jgi:hypothetical protein
LLLRLFRSKTALKLPYLDHLPAFPASQLRIIMHFAPMQTLTTQIHRTGSGSRIAPLRPDRRPAKTIPMPVAD